MVRHIREKIKRQLGKNMVFTTENCNESLLNIFDGILSIMAFDQGFTNNKDYANLVFFL